MNGQEIFTKISMRQSNVCGFWHGNPHPDALPGLLQYFGAADDFELGQKLGDTICWCMPAENNMWQHPQQKVPFDFWGGKQRKTLGEGGGFAECRSVAEVSGFTWPSAQYCDFTGTIQKIERARKAGLGVLSGMWAPFFHDTADAFGMEEYFIKMHTEPEIVHAVTQHIVDFYYEANEVLYAQAKGRIDALFFGNDFGSQLGMLISPQHLQEFVLPHFIRLVKQAKNHGYKVVLHSCGSIFEAIPFLIEAGVDVLHPLQAKAAKMDADTLQQNFGGKIAFMGGIDAQHLMTFGTPADIRKEVKRVKQILGPNLIVSPSHECILPNVPPQNVAALAEAAKE